MPGRIYHNVLAVKALIQAYEKEFCRPLNSVFLLAVSKGQPLAAIKEAIAAGQKAFGENYLQEALAKISVLTDVDVEWHFIGRAQRNKTKKIAAHFQWVHSVASLEIARDLNDHRPSNLPPLNICLQVNVSEADTKSGIPAADAAALAAQCVLLPRLKLRGLMTVPTFKETFAQQRIEFLKLQALLHELNQHAFDLDTLSMGMSADMRAAIAAGATMVRIGTAIFGERGLF